jgi:hypothetical protein
VRASADKYYNIFSARFWLGQLDLRPLGLMRIAFGAALFWSTIDLAPVLRAFFSDDGVAPRSALLGFARANRVSVFDIAGPRWLLVAMFVLTLVAILSFMVGWRTRLAAVVTFVLVSGLHERNLYALDGSDNVIRVTLFWLMFMPSGARYSLDAVRRTAKGEPQVTHGSAMPIRLGQFQIAWVYLNTVLYKWPGATWHDGTALRFALGLDHMFVRRLGQMVFDQRPLVAFGTRATIGTELLFLPLVFVPLCRPLRGPLSRFPPWLFQPTWKSLAVLLGGAMHVGIACLMSVGNFSILMLSTYPLLCEPEWIEPVIRFVERRRLWQAGVGALSRCFPRQPRPIAAPVRVAGRLSAWPATALHRLFLPLLMVTTMWFSLPEGTRIPPLVIKRHKFTPQLDLSPSRMWRPMALMVEEVELWQRWNMFSPKPIDHDAYLLGRGELTNGTVVDVLRGARGNGGAIVPPVLPGFFFTRWTKYISNVLAEQTKDSPWVLGLARYVCREWNTDAPPGRPLLKAFKLYREQRRVPLFSETNPEGWTEQMIWDQQCLPTATTAP